jgi:hypothetical protein
MKPQAARLLQQAEIAAGLMWDCYDLHFTPFHARDRKWEDERRKMLGRCQSAEAFVKRLQDHIDRHAL